MCVLYSTWDSLYAYFSALYRLLQTLLVVNRPNETWRIFRNRGIEHLLNTGCGQNRHTSTDLFWRDSTLLLCEKSVWKTGIWLLPVGVQWIWISRAEWELQSHVFIKAAAVYFTVWWWLGEIRETSGKLIFDWLICCIDSVPFDDSAALRPLQSLHQSVCNFSRNMQSFVTFLF